MNCTALVQCSAVQCSAVQCSAGQGSARQCTAVHGRAGQGRAAALPAVPATTRSPFRSHPPLPCPALPWLPLQMLERESSRERGLERSAKEAKAKARKEAARTAEPLDTVTEEDLAQVGWVVWGPGWTGAGAGKWIGSRRRVCQQLALVRCADGHRRWCCFPLVCAAGERIFRDDCLKRSIQLPYT